MNLAPLLNIMTSLSLGAFFIRTNDLLPLYDKFCVINSVSFFGRLTRLFFAPTPADDAMMLMFCPFFVCREQQYCVCHAKQGCQRALRPLCDMHGTNLLNTLYCIRGKCGLCASAAQSLRKARLEGLGNHEGVASAIRSLGRGGMGRGAAIAVAQTKPQHFIYDGGVISGTLVYFYWRGGWASAWCDPAVFGLRFTCLCGIPLAGCRAVEMVYHVYSYGIMCNVRVQEICIIYHHHHFMIRRLFRLLLILL